MIAIIYLFIATGCYKPIIELYAGDYYLGNKWNTSQYTFFENGTFQNSTSVYDIGGYNVSYGKYTYNNQHLELKGDVNYFFQSHLEVNKRETDDSIFTITFKEFIPFGYENFYEFIHFLKVKGETDLGDTLVLTELNGGGRESTYSDIVLTFPLDKVDKINSLWIERQNLKLGNSISTSKLYNVSSLKYPIVYDFLVNINESSNNTNENEYWSIRSKHNKYIFELVRDDKVVTCQKYILKSSSK